MTRVIKYSVFYLALFLLPSLIQAQTVVEQPASVTEQAAPDPTAKPEVKQAEKLKSTPSDTETLAAAYKREFAFLAEQKRELASRLGEFQAKSQKAEQSLRQRIRTLERENVDLVNQEESLRTQLTAAEHKEESLHERSELLEMTYTQANSTLKNYNRSLEKNNTFTEGENEIKLSMVFAQAFDLLKGLSTVRKTSEKFFLLDGTEVEGSIVHVGNIAAYGISNTGSGILVPAGNNRFRLWAEPAAEVAEGVLNGKFPHVLKMYLFESKERAIDITTEKSAKEIIDSGGLIGWVIVVLGMLALIFVALRTLILYFNGKNAGKIRSEVFGLLANKNIAQALAYSQKQRGPFARLVVAILGHDKAERDHLEDVISETLLHESAPLNRFGSTIMVIATVSPLLGLLGTVTGMISTFDIITEFGTGDPKLLSGGISIALVTTQLGLIVAIPAVLLATMLNSWAETIKRELEETALKVSNIVLGNLPQMTPTKPDVTKKFNNALFPGGEIGYSPI
jgi:biopolymer transport protein ExbB